MQEQICSASPAKSPCVDVGNIVGDGGVSHASQLLSSVGNQVYLYLAILTF